MNIEGTNTILDESGTMEEDLEKILKNKQALLEKLQLDDDDPLKKLMSN
jgi:flagellar biosynthesis/type III secretory pathway chaperone